MKRLLPIALLLAGLAFAGGAGAAMVKVGNLVLVADGGFTPRQLPRHTFAPIKFEGNVGLRTRDGSVPPALLQAIVDFDRDGKLTTAGLPTCSPGLLEGRSPEGARAACANAIVGRGTVKALIGRDDGPPLPVSSPLTIFNGPRQGGRPTAVVHAQTTVPAVQTFVIPIPIEKRRGEFRYRVVLDVPPIAGGRGALTGVEVEIGRRYRAGGQRRSYVAARCSDNVLRTHGRFSFADGMIIDGSVDKGCGFAR